MNKISKCQVFSENVTNVWSNVLRHKDPNAGGNSIPHSLSVKTIRSQNHGTPVSACTSSGPFGILNRAFSPLLWPSCFEFSLHRACTSTPRPDWFKWIPHLSQSPRQAYGRFGIQLTGHNVHEKMPFLV